MQGLRWVFVLSAVAAWAQLPTPEPQFRVERHPLSGGAELVTVFGRATDSDVPLLAVLRDTQGDGNAGNDRLRYLWVLGASRPTLLQRTAAAIPFFYWRAGIGKNGDQTPSPLIDFSAPGSRVWAGLAGSLAQTMAFDPKGALVRSSSRSYRGHQRDHQQLHLLEALAALSQLEQMPGAESTFSEAEFMAMEARLSLAAQPFGGLVGDAKLPEAYQKQRIRATEQRGHNWELLRQRAEANGLYFEPFGLNGAATHALLWIAQEDLDTAREFHSQFLSIADPYHDDRVRNWTGYTEARIGEDGLPMHLIPLGLYSLDHPKVPLLVVDFRDTGAPRRREVFRRAVADAVAGVFGYSKWGNWPYLAGSWTWEFVRTRHGAASNRAARIRAYAQVREWLVFDRSLDATLRADLLKRLGNLGVNPLEDSEGDEARFAERQYAALVRYAEDPQGLPERLDRARSAENAAYEHGFVGRMAVRGSHIASFGLYTHREQNRAVGGATARGNAAP